MTTEAREQATKGLRGYLRAYEETDDVSLSRDARIWQIWEEKYAAAALAAGLTEKEVEAILHGDE